MSSTDTTIAARIPLDLRQELEDEVARRRRAGELRPSGEPIDLSTVVRQALREHAETAAGRPPGGVLVVGRQAGLLDNSRPGSRHRDAGNTERAAALKVAARAGTQRRLALEAFEAAGDHGLTADEVAVKLAPRPLHSLARRVTDLLQGGLIEPHPHESEEWRGVVPATRRTRAGAQATVYRITGAGLLALTTKRRQEADRAKP
jgi:hypothetical protein